MDRVLARVNRTVLFLGTAVFVFVALVLPGVIGAALCLAVAGGLSWLLVRTWPAHKPAARAMRLAVLAFLVVVAVVKLTH